MERIVLQSTALYPREGVAYIALRAASYMKPIGPAYPVLAEGTPVEIHDNQGWIWAAEIISVESEKGCVRITEERRPMPFPAINEAGEVKLPNMSGHAHLRSWRRGDVVSVEGKTYKVAQMKVINHGSDIYYKLAPISAEAYATRPGRISFSSESTARESVGQAVQTKSGEWLHVVKLERTRHNHDGDSSYTWMGLGKHVPADKAAKINALHPRLLDRALSNAAFDRVQGPMPADAVTLVPKDLRSLAATGSRVAVVGKAVLHERTGDPDRLDSWYHYVVQITDPALVVQAKAFVKKASV